jgi:hypothetical protein
MSPEKYHQHLYERLLELTEFPSPETLQPNVEENDLARELSICEATKPVSALHREESSFMMDSWVPGACLKIIAKRRPREDTFDNQ